MASETDIRNGAERRRLWVSLCETVEAAEESAGHKPVAVSAQYRGEKDAVGGETMLMRRVYGAGGSKTRVIELTVGSSSDRRVVVTLRDAAEKERAFPLTADSAMELNSLKRAIAGAVRSAVEPADGPVSAGNDRQGA